MCLCDPDFVLVNGESLCADVAKCDNGECDDTAPCEVNEQCVSGCSQNLCCAFDGSGLKESSEGTCDDALGTDRWHKIADCTNNSGGCSCECIDDYQGNDLACEDVDECEANPCGKNGK